MILETNNVVVFDLDDTLYNEVDFLISAYKEISIKIAVEINVSNEIVYEDVLTFIANSNTSSNINKSKNSIILLYNFDAIVGFNFRKKYI